MICGPKVCADEDDIYVDDRDILSSILSTESFAIGPIVAYDDGYKWPNLYAEIDEMLDTCIVIQPLSQLRKKALEMPIQKAAPIVRLPMTRSQMMNVIEKNCSLLSRTNYDTYELLETTRDRGMLDKSARKMPGSQKALVANTLVAFEDDFEYDSLVYSVEVNSKRQRITICFRGSVDMQWASTFDAYMREMENPLCGHRYADDSQRSTVKVHHCFHDRLFTPMEEEGSDPSRTTAPTAYDKILSQVLEPLMAMHPTYKVSTPLFFQRLSLTLRRILTIAIDLA